jgi:hypothetical protein
MLLPAPGGPTISTECSPPPRFERALDVLLALHIGKVRIAGRRQRGGRAVARQAGVGRLAAKCAHTSSRVRAG